MKLHAVFEKFRVGSSRPIFARGFEPGRTNTPSSFEKLLVNCRPQLTKSGDLILLCSVLTGGLELEDVFKFGKFRVGNRPSCKPVDSSPEENRGYSTSLDGEALGELAVSIDQE